MKKLEVWKKKNFGTKHGDNLFELTLPSSDFRTLQSYRMMRQYVGMVPKELPIISIKSKQHKVDEAISEFSVDWQSKM